MVKPTRVQYRRESVLKKNIPLNKVILLAKNRINLNLKYLLVLAIQITI